MELQIWIQSTQLPNIHEIFLCSRMDAQRSGSSVSLLMLLREIEYLVALKEPPDKTRIFRTMLYEQDLSYFEHHLKKTLEAEDSDIPDNVPIELVLRDQ
jgi:hypothetical protein